MKRPLIFFLLFLSLLAFATPTKALTDTLYFEFALAKGETSATIEYSFWNDVLPGIEMEYNDGEAHPKFSPDAEGEITVTGNGHGRIYYTYEETEGYEVTITASVKYVITGMHVHSLSGIHFTSLDVHACPALKALDCRNNQLTALDVSGCTNLETLWCYNNQLTALDVSQKTALTELYCDFNQLTALDVSGCTALKTLLCNNNQLTALDLSACTALTKLWCNNNQLTSLNASGCTALETLWCYSNYLTSLGVSNNDKLTELRCNNNQLTALDLSACTALKTLLCNNNQLTALDVSANTALSQLYCENNQLTTLNLSNNASLLYLTCGQNHIPLSTLDRIYSPRDNWGWFDAANQTDTLVLSACEALDLSSEKTLGDSITTYVLKDEAGNAVSASAYTQDDFSFVFKEAFAGTLTLQNSSIPRSSMTYHITAEACAAEPPTTTKTDTLRFDVIKETGDSKIEYYFSDKVKAGIEIEWIPSDGGASTRYTPDKNGFTANGVGMYTQTISENGQVRIYYTYAPDAAPYSLGVRNGYTNSNEDISVRCSNNSVTSLNVSGCTHLEDLDCSYNQLTYLDVSSCTDLELLDCTNNQLTYLNVSGCMALKELYCIYNQLTTLDVSGCTDLELLDCTNNQLTTLDVSGCTALTDLECYFNQLTALDVSACTALKELDCKWNQLTTLDASGCTALTKLFCQYNQLTSLDVSQDTALKSLFCDNNHLPLSTLYGIYTQRENWQNFSAENQTDTVNLSACEALNLATEKTLGGAETAFELKDEAGNAVSESAYTEDDFSFTFNDAFAGTLILQNSGLPDVSMTYHITAEACAAEPPTPSTTKTDTLYFEFEIVEGGASTVIEYGFSEAVLPGITMEYYDGQAHPKFTPTATGSIIAHGNGHGWVYYTYEESEGYTVNFSPRYSGSANNSSGDIRLQRYADVNLTALDAHACSAMKSLDCQNNQLTALNVKGCIRLEDLNCSYNSLTDLDVSHNSVLKNLWCRNNQLSALDISHNPALEDLDCRLNQLTELNVSQNSALTSLLCGDNQLTWLDVSHNPALIYLACGGNLLTKLDVSANTALEDLGCGENQLTNLDVSQNPALTYLNCSDNQLPELDVSHNPDLEELFCNENKLTALDVSGCTALTTLYCEDNCLEILDLSDCTVLEILDCSHNRLKSLDVSACDVLEMMGCDNNRLMELAVGENLMVLTCSNNHLPLSTLYGILEPGTLMMLDATHQSDTLVIGKNQPWDLSSEKVLGETETTYTLVDEEGNEVSEDAYTENGFVFRLNTPATYTLRLQNQDLLNINFGTPADPIDFVYHVTVEERFSVSVSANNGAWGWATKTGNGTYGKGKEVTIIATPAEGYRFVNWTREGEVFSINAVYTFAVTENLTLVANFEEIPEEPVVEETFTLYILANDAAWGSVSQSGNGTYKKDSLATITATAAEGYRFVNWMQADGAVFGTKADTTFKVIENLILVARFEKLPDEPLPPVEEDFTITLTPNNPAWGLVFKTGNCVYGEGEEITIFALPFAGYRFVNWTKEDGSVFGTDSLITFKVTESLELTANFEEIPVVPVPVVDSFSVQVFSNNEAWGRVSQSGDGRYEKDSSVSITATPNEGYRFVNWTKDGAIFTTQADTTFAVTEDLELTANFEKIPDEKPTEDDFHIYVKDNVIYLSENRGKVQVFNVIGQCLYTGNTTAIRVRQTGVYIIAVGGQNYKVLVM